MRDSNHGLLLSVLASPAQPRSFVFSSLVLSLFILMLCSTQLIPSPLSTVLHLGQQRPSGTYLVSVFIPTACLWPTGKLQSVIFLQVDRNLPIHLLTRACSLLRFCFATNGFMSILTTSAWYASVFTSNIKNQKPCSLIISLHFYKYLLDHFFKQKSQMLPLFFPQTGF